MGEIKVYFTGLPTEGDVRALKERFGEIKEGDEIPYVEIDAILVCDREVPTGPGSYARWRVVTTAWRRDIMREKNLLLRASGDRFVVMHGAERVGFASGKVRTGVRAFRKAFAVVSTTERHGLTPIDRVRADHVQRCSAALLQHAAVEQKKRPKPELPKVTGEK